MPYAIEVDFPTDCDGAAVLRRLEGVLDPELDAPILELGFVRSLALHAGHATIVLQLPTSWCAVNFAYMMAQDVRDALRAVAGVDRVTVRLGDHCAAAEIETAVNSGTPFAAAFPGEGAGSLAALRQNFLRKGFLARQERLLRALRDAGWSFAAISVLRLDEVSVAGGVFVVRHCGTAPLASGPAAILRQYLERRAELGLDCHPAARLIVDLAGDPLPTERLQAHYCTVRTVRVSLEANGSFCRAMLATRRRDTAASPAPTTNRGGTIVSL
jgi:metal-sulfur cluster biosynthetic enzyme